MKFAKLSKPIGHFDLGPRPSASNVTIFEVAQRSALAVGFCQASAATTLLAISPDVAGVLGGIGVVYRLEPYQDSSPPNKIHRYSAIVLSLSMSRPVLIAGTGLLKVMTSPDSSMPAAHSAA